MQDYNADDVDTLDLDEELDDKEDEDDEEDMGDDA